MRNEKAISEGKSKDLKEENEKINARYDEVKTKYDQMEVEYRTSKENFDFV